jgi:uncharacterized protein YecE (DUF72 family)
MRMNTVRIGTSGWVYPQWRGTFYPKDLPHQRELEYLSHQVNSVELNGSFYSLRRPIDYQNWAAQVPEDFVFAVKASRYLTHVKRLHNVETPLANFLASGVLALGAKLGPILWQLPPTFRYEPDTLAQFFALLPRTTTAAVEIAKRHDDRLKGRAWTRTDADRPLRHALEVRHSSFANPEFFQLLRAHNVAVVIADTAGRFPYLEELTVDFGYIRLHGSRQLYQGGYSATALDDWAEKIRQWSAKHDMYVYFDNDIAAMAPRDAMALRERLK